MTHSRCDGIFNHLLIANLLLSLLVEKNENQLTFGKDIGKSIVYCFFDSRDRLNDKLCLTWIFNTISLRLAGSRLHFSAANIPNFDELKISENARI